MAGIEGWGFMLHGNIFVGYDWFGSRRGSHKFISVNSLMGVAWHPLGPGEIMFRSMLSAEPLTVGTEGYPLVLQSGETAGGAPLHDRQHPHDLFMELAAIYVLPLSADLALQLYLAPAGEPALGPTAFPHRVWRHHRCDLQQELEARCLVVQRTRAGREQVEPGFSRPRALSPGVGIRGSIGFVEAALDSFYGTQLPLGVMGVRAATASTNVDVRRTQTLSLRFALRTSAARISLIARGGIGSSPA